MIADSQAPMFMQLMLLSNVLCNHSLCIYVRYRVTNAKCASTFLYVWDKDKTVIIAPSSPGIRRRASAWLSRSYSSTPG
jgi:hypothetical protein